MKWLYPGMAIKRWLLLCAFGVLLVSAGIALVAGVEILSVAERWIVQVLVSLTGSLPVGVFTLVGAAIILSGVGIAAFGFRKMVRSLIGAFAPEVVPHLAEIVYEQRHLRRGPRIVAIGGGTGLSTLLRGLKEYSSNITAIVVVSDDGGSSGRLREEFGMLPPGDIRNTLLALADVEPLMERLFQHRFGAGRGLMGHSFGNLLIAAMTEVTGDFEEAVRAFSRVLAIRGQVLPGTLDEVVLRAEFTDGSVVRGESKIPMQGKRIRRIDLEPNSVCPTDHALRAIAEADAIVLGPGSLYTSVIPNLLIDDLARAVRRADAVKVYICNVMTQPGETDGYSVSDHVRAIWDHVGPGLFRYVLMNDAAVPRDVERRYAEEGATVVPAEEEAIRQLGLIPVRAPLISGADLARHDPDLLAEAVITLVESEIGPRQVANMALSRIAMGYSRGNHGRKRH